MIITSSSDLISAIENIVNDPIVEIPSGGLYAWTGAIATPFKLILHSNSRFFLNGKEMSCNKGVTNVYLNGYEEE